MMILGFHYILMSSSLFFSPHERAAIDRLEHAHIPKNLQEKEDLPLVLNGILYRPDLNHWIVWINGVRIYSQRPQSIQGWNIVKVTMDSITVRSSSGEERDLRPEQDADLDDLHAPADEEEAFSEHELDQNNETTYYHNPEPNRGISRISKKNTQPLLEKEDSSHSDGDTHTPQDRSHEASRTTPDNASGQKYREAPGDGTDLGGKNNFGQEAGGGDPEGDLAPDKVIKNHVRQGTIGPSKIGQGDMDEGSSSEFSQEWVEDAELSDAENKAGEESNQVPDNENHLLATDNPDVQRDQQQDSKTDTPDVQKDQQQDSKTDTPDVQRDQQQDSKTDTPDVSKVPGMEKGMEKGMGSGALKKSSTEPSTEPSRDVVPPQPLKPAIGPVPRESPGPARASRDSTSPSAASPAGSVAPVPAVSSSRGASPASTLKP